MIRILHSVSNMDRAGIETMLMNYYRYMDKSKVQFDFLVHYEKRCFFDDEIESIREFSSDTQLSMKKKDNIEICPLLSL